METIDEQTNAMQFRMRHPIKVLSQSSPDRALKSLASAIRPIVK
jgi:hypothetical protein